MNIRLFAAVLAVACLSVNAEAALFFFDDGDASSSPLAAPNWAPDGVPGDFDLAVHNNPSIGPVVIDANWSVDSFRMSDGADATQNAGTLTISTGFGPDAGLWVGEFGPAQVTYTLNGGSIVTQDPFDGFFVGRAGGSDAVFTQAGGSVTVAGDAHIGLDGTAAYNQSSGTFVADGIQVGRFASPTADVNLSGDASFSANGLLLLSDGADAIPSAIRSDLNITGSNVSVTADGLILRDKANLNFIADAGGISPIVLGAGPFEVWSNPVRKSSLSVDLSAFATAPPIITLIDGSTGIVGDFDGLPQGTIVPGAGGRWIHYSGGADGFDVQLVPEPATLGMVLVGLIGLATRRN